MKTLLSTLLITLVITFLISILPDAVAKNSAKQNSEKSDFTGAYQRGDRETLSQLFILNDKTFCYTFMGGSLDMLVGGRWEYTNDKKESIQLKEVRPHGQIHPAYASHLERSKGLVEISIDGYSFSNARMPVFAISSTNEIPTSFRPLFSEDQTTWSGTYVFPLIEAAQARYIFVGDAELGTYDKPKRLRITQYELGNNDTVKFGVDETQARDAMQFTAKLKNNFLTLNNEQYGKKSALQQDIVDDIRQTCIYPALSITPILSVSYDGEKEVIQITNKGNFLQPVKTFYASLDAIKGETYFNEQYQSADTDGDPVAAIFQAETEQLNHAFKLASNDIKNVDEFLLVTKEISNKSQRLHKHAAQLVQRYAELMVNLNSKGEFATTEKMLLNYIEQLHPQLGKVKNELSIYATSVIASQGFVIAAVKNKPQIGDLVLTQLLNTNFDIRYHQNSTLIYNMACFYATQQRKPAMLEAIRQARQRDKPAQQFKDDADFKAYWNDPDFINAIK